MPDPDFHSPLLDDALASLPALSAHAPAQDEAFWAAVAGLYRTSRAEANLENGFWGPMAEPVRQVFMDWTERVNFENTLLIRSGWPRLMETVRGRVAAALGCAPEEIALTRGATESMLALIGGYNRLQPGDTVLYADLDYPAMRNAMEWLRGRRGVVPVKLTLPEPATRENLLATYAQALQQHPRTRLVLLTHLSHATGLVLPVRELADLAQAAGAEVVVDAAHSWGQMDFNAPDLGVPYAAFNLHKWIGAPLGCGCLYIRKGSVPAIDPYFGDREYPPDDVRGRIYTGSPNFAAWLSIPAALQLHRHIGAAAKQARLRHLRDHWVQQVRGLPGLEILTPDAPGMVAGITSLRFAGRTSAADNQAMAAALRERHGVFTVWRSGPSRGDVVRVTPALHTTYEELDRLVQGLKALAG